MNRLSGIKSGIALVLFFVFSPVHAYHPGKWSHTDDFILNKNLKGPSELKVFDEKGTLLQRAAYEYRSDGLLLKEKYYNGKGAYTGRTEYDYDSSGSLRRESLFNGEGELLNRTAYNFEGHLPKTISVYNPDGSLLLTQNYNISNGKLTGGEEITGENVDLFSFDYEGSQLSSVNVFGDQKEVLSKVLYAYQNGLLIERRREQGQQVSTCKYEYEKGRLKSYTFYNMQQGKWSFDKKLELIY